MINAPTVGRIRVLLAEDHKGMAEQLQALLEEDFEVVGVVDNGLALVQAEEELAPDVIVSDIAMPVMDGLTAGASILRRRPDARIVFISVLDEPSLVRRAFAAGAWGYVRKIAASDELVPAILATLRVEHGDPSPARTGANGQGRT
jgi:DNA-binding NarL/FixJ family response regulator